MDHAELIRLKAIAWDPYTDAELDAMCVVAAKGSRTLRSPLATGNGPHPRETKDTQRS